MVSRQCANAASCHHSPHRWTSGGSLVRRIDKADLLFYKHKVLAVEKPGGDGECL